MPQISYKNKITFQNYSLIEILGKISELFKGEIIVSSNTIFKRRNLSVVIDTVGSGHNALAAFLADHNVDIVICGGIGQGAIVSLAMAGIDIVPGVAGSPDKAVKELLEGTLVAGAVSGCGCGGHHHEEGEGTCGCGGHHDDTCDISGKEGKGGCGCGCH